MTNSESQKNQNTSLFTVGLAIFAMLFGAGNIIWPIKGGVFAGSQNFFGIMGFTLTAVLLPVVGLVAMILFDGDYHKFFSRIGKIPSFIAITFCMLIIGPFIAMPRCITVPYDMIATFLPSWLTLPIFTITFTSIAFLLTFKESKLLDVLGKVLSPIKIITIALIIIKGLLGTDHQVTEQTMSAYKIFWNQFMQGFQTLDLLGTIFFAYIIVKILKTTNKNVSKKELLNISLQGGLLGAGMLALVYIGMGYIAMYYSYLVDSSMNGAEMFTIIASHILKDSGSVVIVTTVLMACLATLCTLSVVLSEYLKQEVFKNKISYKGCLFITLATTTVISNFGLSKILTYSAPIINFGYPIIIMITFCNLAYGLFGFKPIKVPVALMTIAMFIITVGGF